ncbi:MAG: GntR family transcriptional regulator [Silicimonas sp.]|nr:GntR family transcriptional regulator [Silicimonas sp.]
MNAPTTELSPIEDRTLRAQVRRQILDRVLGGHFKPGERLVETALSSQLRVSRAPLREALRELVDQGILVSEPYKGFRVRPVSERDLKELFSMRTALEKFAFALAWPLRTPQGFAELDKRHDDLMSIRATGDQAKAIECEIAFHAWVYETTDHRLLMDHWARLSHLVRIYMSLHHNLHGSHGEFGEMTTRYRDLCNGGSLDAMLLHIDEHMTQGFDSVVKALK